MKRLWLVRLGRNGEYDPAAIEQSLLTIGFNVTVDLKAAKDREAVLKVMKSIYPDAKPGTQANFAAQVNQFVNTMTLCLLHERAKLFRNTLKHLLVIMPLG